MRISCGCCLVSVAQPSCLLLKMNSGWKPELPTGKMPVLPTGWKPMLPNYSFTGTALGTGLVAVAEMREDSFECQR